MNQQIETLAVIKGCATGLIGRMHGLAKVIGLATFPILSVASTVHASPDAGQDTKPIKTTVKVIAVSKSLDDRAPLDLIKIKPLAAKGETDGLPSTAPMAEPLLVERSDDLLYSRQPSAIESDPQLQPSSPVTADVGEKVAKPKRVYRQPRPRRVKAASVTKSKTWKRSLSLSFQEGD